MKSNGERSLKSLNMKWLVLLAAADVLFVLLFVAPDLLNGVTLTQVGIGRVLTTTVMPVVVLLIVNVLPHDVKSMLVYWEPLGVLPGCALVRGALVRKLEAKCRHFGCPCRVGFGAGRFQRFRVWWCGPRRPGGRRHAQQRPQRRSADGKACLRHNPPPCRAG